MEELIARDQNRTSVILWSLSNETPLGAARLEFLKKLADYTRSLDPTRLVTSAMNSTERAGPKTQTLNDPLGEYLDVLGVNEHVGWYWGRPEDADKMKWTTKWEKPLVISEFGGEALAGRHGGQYTRWTEEFQANLYSHQIRMLSGIDDLAGMSPWLLMDYRSPRRQRPGVQNSYNRKGSSLIRGKRSRRFLCCKNITATGPPPTDLVVRLLRAPETPTRICKACFQASGSSGPTHLAATEASPGTQAIRRSQFFRLQSLRQPPRAARLPPFPEGPSRKQTAHLL
jgi:beta-glucuronidase